MKLSNRQQQLIDRLESLMLLSRQRYLESGGNPHQTSSGLPGNDYLSDEERQEALMLARTIFNDEYINQYCQKKIIANNEPNFSRKSDT